MAQSLEYAEIPEEKKQHEEGKIGGPAFDLPIEDDDLADIIDKNVEETETYYRNKIHLEERRKLLEEFWVGKQVDESKTFEWQVPYLNNKIWEDEEKRISIIASRMPDIVVTPANETREKREHAKILQKGLRIKIDDDKMRRMIKDGLRHHDLYLLGCLKIMWDRNVKDFIYEIVRPQKLIIPHYITIPQDGFTADNMEWIVEWIEAPVAQVLADFPNKKDDILKSMGMVRGTTKQLNSKMRYQQVWFSFYGDDGKLYEGLTWKLKKLILDKERNPYWDWEGYEEADQDSDKKNTIYRNHFDRPRKPYMFFVYQNLGKGPIEETSPVEQSIPLQKVLNKRGNQITELADRSGPKLAFIADAITKEEVRRVSHDPDEHIFLGGNVQDVSKAMMVVVGQPPSPALVQDLMINMSQIDAKFSTHSVSKGEKTPQESGISKQISREGDLASHDDMSKVTVERVVYEAANWAVQMMKLFYDKNHFVKNVGRDGEMSFLELKRDLIDEGIAVNVEASSVDKAQRRFDAQTSAARRQIDPLTYNEDLETPNPKERTRRLIAFLSGGQDGWKSYYEMTDLAPDEMKDVGDKEAEVDIERIKENEEFDPPVPTPKYLQKMIEFVQSDEYKSLPAEKKKKFKEFVAELRKKFEEQYLTPQPGQAAEGIPGTPPEQMQPPQEPMTQPTAPAPSSGQMPGEEDMI